VVEAATGSMHDRMSAAYDPPTHLAAAKKTLGDQLRAVQISDSDRNTIDRIVESRHRQLDIKAQLLLHRRLKRWLVAHVATASALVILLAFHILTALIVF